MPRNPQNHNAQNLVDEPNNPPQDLQGEIRRDYHFSHEYLSGLKADYNRRLAGYSQESRVIESLRQSRCEPIVSGQCPVFQERLLPFMKDPRSEATFAIEALRKDVDKTSQFVLYGIPIMENDEASTVYLDAEGVAVWAEGITKYGVLYSGKNHAWPRSITEKEQLPDGLNQINAGDWTGAYQDSNGSIFVPGMCYLLLRFGAPADRLIARLCEFPIVFVELSSTDGGVVPLNLDTPPSAIVGINIADEPNLSDETLKDINALTKLQWLQLGNNNLSDAAMLHVSAIKTLRQLRLSDTNITDVGLKHLANLSVLEVLDLDGTKITDEGLTYLTTATNLTTLKLSHTKINGEGLVPVASLQKLTHLWLRNTQLSHNAWGAIGGLHALEYLNLDGTNVGDTDLKQLERMRKLNWLVISNTDITKKGIDSLKILKTLRYLDIEGASVNNEEVNSVLPQVEVTTNRIE